MLADRILFIDAEAIILDKPAGLPVTEGRDGAIAVENHLDSLRLGFQRRPTIVHRLDRDTSGCLLLARNPKAHRRFSAAFEAGVVTKLYWAVLAGVPAANEGTIDLPLHKVSTREAGWRIVPDPRGKRAVTHWSVMEARDGRALVAFRPETGRTHQLRVHAAAGIGVPIVGDPVYGRAAAGGMLLHARSLSMPRDGKSPAEATAPLPAAFAPFGVGDAGT
ncbi:RNA pseudouridine synthase [Sphingomonas sp. 1P06PA]|uniref:RluA family pseudouridine synthase n=1 Tax=Sphingomonas sp. 1P06PA TaxID=554121 RepID=UPI0039A586D8